MWKSATRWLLLGFALLSAAAGAQTTLTASPTAVAVGGTVTATWSNIASPSSSNYIVIAVPGGAAVPGSIHTTATASGSAPYVLPTSLAQGTYELRLFNPSNVLLATSNTFTVGPPVTVSGTTTASGAVLAGVSVAATNGGTCTASNSSGAYSCTVLQGWTGTITPTFSGFTLTPASRDYTNVAANTTAQNYDASSTSQITAAPTAVAVGGTVTAGWSNVGSPSSSNFFVIALPGQGAVPGSQRTNSAAASGSVPYALPTSLAQGTYQLRLLNPSGVLMAISNTFTVGPPVTVSGTTTASGAVLAGVSVAATNGGTCSASNSSGAYSCTVLQGWTGTITPTFSGFTLTPASRDYTNVTANTSAQNYDASSTSQASASPTAVAVGGTVTATWSNVTAPSASNIFFLAAPGQAAVPGSKATGSAATSGSVPYTLPTNLAQGTYQLRLYTPGAVTLLAISNTFTVGPPVTVSGTTTASGAVLAGVSVAATNGGTCTTSSSSGAYSCTVLQGWTGTITPTFSGFTLTPASRDYSNVTANTTAQDYDASSVSQISGSPAAVAVGGTVTAGWSNVTSPSASNIFVIAAPGQAAVPGSKATGSAATSGSVPYTLPSNLAQGTYQLRLYTPGAVTLLAISNTFIAGPLVTITGSTTASGAVIAGVTLTATNGGTCTVSDASGQYTCTVLQGWTGTITPTYGNFTLTPASRNYTNVTANTSAQNYDASSASQITAAPGAVAVGGTVTAGWSNVTSPSAGNIFVIALPGQAAVPGSQHTSSAATSGSVPYTLPTSLAQGTYQLRLLTPDGATLLAISNTFNVGPPVTVGGTVTASGAVFAGVNVAATNGGTCTASNSSGQYSCTVLQGWTGTITPTFSGFTLTPASRDYTNVTANTAAQDYVASSISQASANPAAVAVGGTVTAGWSNVTTPSASNVFVVALPGQAAVPGSHYTGSAAASGSVPYVLPASLAQGTYQLRLYTPDFATLLAISNNFTVGPPVTVNGTATAGGAALAGVNFSVTNGGTCTASNSSGQYSCTVLQGWSGNIMPSLSGHSFSPASRDYTGVSATVTGENYAAVYQVIGTVTSHTAPLAGVTVTATNGATCTPSTASGQYTCTVQHGWSGTLTPSLQGYVFAPASRDLTTVTAHQTGQDYTATPPFQLTGTATSNGLPLAGVAFTAPNGGACVPSNASGQYSCAVPVGWSGSVTPSLSGYVFNPASHAYSNVIANEATQDYAATPTYQVTGTATSGGSPLAGVTLTATNGGTCTVSNAAGQYSCTVLQGWSGSVIPSSAGYAFAPVSRAYTAVAADQSAQDYTAGASYTLTGTVAVGSTPTAGVAFIASSGGICTASNASGQYSCTVPQAWTGSVTPSLAGYGFTPASRAYNGIADDQAAQDYAAANVGATTVYYIHPDHLNTPRMIADQASTTVWRWDQGEPFGNDVPNDNPSGAGTFDFPLRFPGQYFDRETNVAYNYYRDYDPSIGRYIESDPIGLKGGLNTFAYVGDDPLLSVDPTGLVNWKGTVAGAAGGFIGGLGGYYFTVTSECKCGYKITISGLAGGLGLYYGASWLSKIPKLAKLPDMSGGAHEFYDYYECPNPDAANGIFAIREMTFITAGNTKVQLGHLRTYVPDRFLEPELSSGFSWGMLVGWSQGKATRECCSH